MPKRPRSSQAMNNADITSSTEQKENLSEDAVEP